MRNKRPDRAGTARAANRAEGPDFCADAALGETLLRARSRFLNNVKKKSARREIIFSPASVHV